MRSKVDEMPFWKRTRFAAFGSRFVNSKFIFQVMHAGSAPKRLRPSLRVRGFWVLQIPLETKSKFS